MPRKSIKCSVTSEQPFRLVPAIHAPHKFGGTCNFSGITPTGTEVPVQQVLLLDLSDSNVPFTMEPHVRYLPLLYPFKYGFGGPEIQYAIVSETKVRILYMSDSQPDDPESQYLQVPALPEQPLALQALSYEEARCLAFMREDGFFQPNRSDRAILKKLGSNNLIKLGGRRNYIANKGEVICRNPECKLHGKRTSFQFVAMVPPIPVNGTDDFWHEFQGGDVDFVFVFCHFCGTIIAFNVAG